MTEPADRSRTYRWDDPSATGAALRALDGLTAMARLADGTLPVPPIAATLGFRWLAVDPGRVVLALTPDRYQCNPAGTLHGGVLATVCVSACGSAVQTLLPAGRTCVSADLTVRFLGPAELTAGELRCTATVLHLGTGSAVAHSRLVDGAGTLLAYATSGLVIRAATA